MVSKHRTVSPVQCTLLAGALSLVLEPSAAASGDAVAFSLACSPPLLSSTSLLLHSAPMLLLLLPWRDADDASAY